MSKIAILTNFQEMNPGYSLTGIVQDQARMLLSYGHEVSVFVSEHFNDEKYPALPHGDFERYCLPSAAFEVVPQIPFTHQIDYSTVKDLSPDHMAVADDLSNRLVIGLADTDYVFTHDFIFTGWNLPFGAGIRKAGRTKKLKHLRWFNWIHSIPNGSRDWWFMRAYGPTHRIVYPNKTDTQRVAENYRTGLESIRVIPHIKDPRSWWEFDKDTCAFLIDFPNIMQADFLQIYPASSDRLTSKGVKEIMCIFKEIKKRGYKVFFVLANQWATGTQRKEDIEAYIKYGTRNGLVWGEDFTFTSEWKEKYATGIPRKMLRELFLLSNLFIFPTREESFGLVAPEAGLSGVLPIWNKSLLMQQEVNGLHGLYLNFGSHETAFKPESWREYLKEIASLIIGRMQRDESLSQKTWHRKMYNWDHIYNRYYEPFMIESKLWA